MTYCSRMRRVKSKGATLVLTWNFLVVASFFVIIDRGSFSNSMPVYVIVFLSLELPAMVFALLLSGWLADVYFGRYKVMRTCMRFVWVSSIAGAVVLIIQSLTLQTAFTYILLLPRFCQWVGCAAYIANVVPFGTDQIFDGSSDEVSAFVNWYVWTWFSGYWVAHMCNSMFKCAHLDSVAVDLFQFFFSAILLSLALSLDFLCWKWLIIEPKSQNPFKTVLRVLKYAATHKYPEQRSAFTYCEGDIPSRIDFGKEKYGGPFTTTEVEDMKTFFRILLVFLCVVGNVTGVILLSLIPLSARQHFRTPKNLSKCSGAVAAASYDWSMVATLTIPVCELFLYPLAWNWIPGILKRIGIGAALTIVLGILMTVFDSVGHAITSTQVPCIFMANETAVLDINYLWVDICSSVVIGLQFAIFAPAAFEFICSQSPYSMKGLLNGLGWSMFVLPFALAVLLIIAWSQGWKETYSIPSCGTLYYTFATLVSIVGLVVYVMVARWYKRRHREEPEDRQDLIESVYYRRIKENQRTTKI